MIGMAKKAKRTGMIGAMETTKAGTGIDTRSDTGVKPGPYIWTGGEVWISTTVTLPQSVSKKFAIEEDEMYLGAFFHPVTNFT